MFHMGCPITLVVYSSTTSGLVLKAVWICVTFMARPVVDDEHRTY